MGWYFPPPTYMAMEGKAIVGPPMACFRASLFLPHTHTTPAHAGMRPSDFTYLFRLPPTLTSLHCTALHYPSPHLPPTPTKPIATSSFLVQFISRVCSHYQSQNAGRIHQFRDTAAACGVGNPSTLRKFPFVSLYHLRASPILDVLTKW